MKLQEVKETRAETSVALAITSRALLLVESTRHGDDWRITSHAAAETPEGSVEDARVVDPQALGKAIRALWKRQKLRHREVAVVIPSTGCSLRALHFPAIPPDERRNVVRGELEHTKVLPPGQGFFDFLWLANAGNAGGSATAEAYAVVADDVIEGYIHALRQAGLKIARMEPAWISIFRAYLSAVPSSEPCALICPDAEQSDFSIYAGGELRYLRRIPYGWRDVPPPDELPPTGRHAAPMGDMPDPVRSGAPLGIAQAPAAQHSFLASEISRSLAFYARNRDAAECPQAVQLVGAGPAVASLRDHLDDALRVPVNRVDLRSLYNLTCEANVEAATPAELDQALLAAVGSVSAGRAQEAVPLLNVAHSDNREIGESLIIQGLKPALVSASLCFAVAIGIATMVGNDNKRLSAHASDLSDKIAGQQSRQAPARRLESISRAIAEAKRRDDVPAAQILGRVAEAGQAGISLNTLRIGPDGKVQLEGRAITTESIQQFATVLGQGMALLQPRIQNIRQEPEGTLSFQVSGRFGPGSAAPTVPVVGGE